MYPVRPNAARAKTALICFCILMLFIVVAAIISAWQFKVLSDVTAGFPLAPNITLSNLFSQSLAIIRLGMFIVCAVFFIRWFRRAYFNLYQYNPNAMFFSEGWAAGAWFVPIMSLGRPYRIMREIWMGSRQALDTDPAERQPTTLLGIWWLFWILYNVSGQIVFQLSRTAKDFRSLQLLLGWTLISDFMELTALALVIVIVRQQSHIETHIERAITDGGADNGIFDIRLNPSLNADGYYTQEITPEA